LPIQRRDGAIALFFAEAGASAFGSGLAIIPFTALRASSTPSLGLWAEFLDAVAIGLISRPVAMIMASFVGICGPAGCWSRSWPPSRSSCPCYFFVVVPGTAVPAASI